MSAMRALIWCDEAEIPAAVGAESWSVQKPIMSRGPAATLNLRAQNLVETVLTSVSSRASDLVRIAAYIYAADQDLSRGGVADVYGRDWRRHIALCLPVSDPVFWQQDVIQSRLVDVLSFLTEDRWEFYFSQAPPAVHQIPLPVNERTLLATPDTVILFSGGADSLSTAVEAAIERGERPVLVSHRPAPQFDARQHHLADALRQRFPQWTFPQIGFWVHRKGSDSADSSQRSRAFLFASLGAAVATELDIGRVLLGDNGIISLNLPFTGQLVGALASRSTHPAFLRLFNDLLAEVFPRPIQVTNPLLFQTRAEVLNVLQDAGCAELLQETNSCSRGRGRPGVTPHCGFCSQCVDRRFGAIAAGLEDHDLAERYGLDIFTQTLPIGEARTVAESYVRFARRLKELSDEQYFDEYPQLYDCIDPRELAPHETASRLAALLKQHANNVLDVVATMVARYSPELAAGVIPEDSLLRLVVGGVSRVVAESTEESNIFMQEGKIWTLVFRGHTARVNDSRGLNHLVGLLRHPGQQFHVISMISGDWAPSGEDGHRRITSSDALDAGLRRIDPSAAEPQIDDQARAEYKMELDDLQERLNAAEMRNDRDDVAQLEQQIDFIIKELRSAAGRGGRMRPVRDAGEKARQAVHAAINRSLKSLRVSHPLLGRHLDQALKLGFFCSYEPDFLITWAT